MEQEEPSEAERFEAPDQTTGQESLRSFGLASPAEALEQLIRQMSKGPSGGSSGGASGGNPPPPWDFEVTRPTSVVPKTLPRFRKANGGPVQKRRRPTHEAHSQNDRDRFWQR